MRAFWLVIAAALAAGLPAAAAAPVGAKRIAFIVESWYPHSHADVIGTRFLEGYRLGGRTVASPLTVSSVYADAPRAGDQTRALAARYGFKVAASVAEALLDDPRASRPKLVADGILVATREDPPQRGRAPSPSPRTHVMREIYRIFDQAAARVPIFLDKMVASNWQDSQTLVAEGARRGVPLMGGSVLPLMPLERPVRTGKIEVGIAVAGGPYWAYSHHAAEALQGLMEQRGARETGVTAIRDVGGGYWSMPDRDRWGGRLMDALLASAKTRRGGGVPGGSGASVLLIQYADGARAVLALLPRTIDEAEFLLGTQLADGSMSTGGLMLQGPPFDHFGYLVSALADLYTTGRPPVPVERALLTTGIVLLGQEARESGGVLQTPSLAIAYQTPKGRP